MSRRFFKPIREDLKKVSDVTKDNFPNKTERALELRRLLNKIGGFISQNLRGEQSDARSSLETRLW
jgi:chromodomain-helicase-DNA-binding protein 1